MSDSSQDGGDTAAREIALKERELSLKEAEHRSWLKNPLILSISGAILAVTVQIVGESVGKIMKQSDEVKQYEASLIGKAIENQDPNRVIAKLQLLNALNLVPNYSKEITTLLRDEESIQSVSLTASAEAVRQYQAALIEKALVPDDPLRVKAKLQLLSDAELIPEYKKRLEKVLKEQAIAALPSAGLPPSPTVTSPTATPPTVVLSPITLQPSATTAAATRADACAKIPVDLAAGTGWLYLGRTNGDKSAWEATDSGSRSVRFASPIAMPDGDLVKKLQNQCLSTLTAKYLREDGEPGKKVNSKVKRAIPAGTHLRIVEIDSEGIDDKSQSKYPVIWARVVVLDD